VPGGSDGGDYYLAGVQRKIWLLWTQQIKSGFTHPVTVSFTILANGSVEDVRVVQGSGASLLDFAAQRSVLSAAPFHPLPKEYGTNRYTIQAIFRPTTP
jgi:TonB family protein